MCYYNYTKIFMSCLYHLMPGYLKDTKIFCDPFTSLPSKRLSDSSHLA
jgi:hypothetical protein